MNKEYTVNSKKQKKALKKYRKALIKIVIASLICVLGLTLPGHILADLIVKNVFIDSETSLLITVLTKTIMMVGGLAGTIVNTIKAHHAMKEYEGLEDEEEEIVQYLEKENEDTKEKTISLEKELTKVKEKSKEPKNNSLEIKSNESVLENQEDVKDNIKVKKK